MVTVVVATEEAFDHYGARLVMMLFPRSSFRCTITVYVKRTAAVTIMCYVAIRS